MFSSDLLYILIALVDQNCNFLLLCFQGKKVKVPTFLVPATQKVSELFHLEVMTCVYTSTCLYWDLISN